MSRDNASIQWFLSRDGQQYGPYPHEQFQDFLSSRHILPTDFVWRSDEQIWQPAFTVLAITSPPRESTSPSPQSTTSAPTFSAQQADTRSGNARRLRMTTFRNPANGYVERVGAFAWLWSLLFGPFY